jgi:hypothetical protein
VVRQDLHPEFSELSQRCLPIHLTFFNINLKSGLRFGKHFGCDTVQNGENWNLSLSGETRPPPRVLKIGPEVPTDQPDISSKYA